MRFGRSRRRSRRAARNPYYPHYPNYTRRNLATTEGGDELQGAIEAANRSYQQMGPNQELITVNGPQTGVAANPNVNGTVAVATGLTPVRRFSLFANALGATTPKTALLFDAIGIHQGACGCYDLTDLADVGMNQCDNYDALLKTLQDETFYLDTVRIVARDLSGKIEKPNAGMYTISVSRQNVGGKKSSDDIQLMDYIDGDQFNNSIVTVKLGANDERSVLDKNTAWIIQGLEPDMELTFSFFVGVVKK